MYDRKTYQRVWELHLFGMTNAEIARKLKVSRGMVRTRLLSWPIWEKRKLHDPSRTRA